MKGKKSISNIKEDEIMSKLVPIKKREQLKQIYAKAFDQNQSLKNDVLMLKNRIEIIVEKQKNNNQKPISEEEATKLKQLKSMQKQVRDQYKIMTELKKRKQQSASQNVTEQFSEQLNNLQNKLKILEQQISQVKVTVSVLKKENAGLQQTNKNHQSQLTRNDPKVAEFEQQNSELRKKITAFKKVTKQKQYESVNVVNNLYKIKHKVSKNQTIFAEIQKSEKKKLSELRSQKLPDKSELINSQQLQKEVESLKKEIQKIEQGKIKEQYLNKQKRQQIIQSNRQEMKKLKNLQVLKTKHEFELNKLKKTWQNYLESKSNNKYLKQYASTAVEVDQFQQIELPLRKDYAGILGHKFRFDDRLILRQNNKALIIGFYIYELENAATSKNMLVGLRAIYNDPTANQSNILPIPGGYLSKCKTSKLQLTEGDFIKLFKIKFSSVEGRILKIQIRSNQNNKYEFGDRRSFNDISQGENVYGFDIGIKEYPVCIFGSLTNVRSHWFLQSLGVQINDL